MDEHAEAEVFEPAPRRSEQPQVLEAAAGEHDRPRIACLGAGLGRAGGDRLVEGRGDRRPRPSRGEIVVRGRDERRSVAEAPGVGLGLGVACELLQLDRSLALVAHLVADAEHRGDSVEQPAHPRGERRIELQALADERPALERHGPSGPLEVHGRRPPRLADRRLAARERDGIEVRDALEPGRGRSAAARRPRACRRCRSRCRRRRARAPVLPRRARRGRRRRARGGAARRRAPRPARPPTSSTGTRDAGRGRRRRADAEHRQIEREVGAKRPVGGLGVEVAEVRGERTPPARGRRRTCSSARRPQRRAAARGAATGRRSADGA